MAFDPKGFLKAARLLLAEAPEAEATLRTVCGRAYYAAYGTIRIQLCRAKRASPGELFGRAGRHGDVINALARGSAQFKSISIQYRRLHVARVKSDYRYSAEVVRQEAEMALDGADWIASRLTRIKERDFKSLPLAPIRHR